MAKIPSQILKARRARLWQILDRQKLDAALFNVYEEDRYRGNVFWLCGFSGSNGQLIITRRGAYLLTDGRYITQAEEEVSGARIVTYKWAEKNKTLVDTLKRARVKRLGVEGPTHRDFLMLSKICRKSKTKLTDVSDELRPLRGLKDDYELAQIRRAIRIQETTFKKVEGLIRPGVSERKIALELDYQMRKAGATDIAFDTIVAAGPRAALPHAKPTARKVRSGELVVVDFGAAYNGYCSDQTVTVSVGKPKKRARQIFEIVKAAQDAALASVRPGIKLAQLDSIAREQIRIAGHEKHFTHSLGHGIGLRVHEWPTVSATSKDVAQQGMVFSIEPGIYLPHRLGVRLEDLVLVTKRGYKKLTRLKKEL